MTRSSTVTLSKTISNVKYSTYSSGDDRFTFHRKVKNPRATNNETPTIVFIRELRQVKYHILYSTTNEVNYLLRTS